MLTQIFITGTVKNAQALSDVQVVEGYDEILNRITLLDDIVATAIDGFSPEVAEFRKSITAKKSKRISKRMKI